VSAPGDYDNGEIGGMIGRANRSSRRKPALVPLCPPETPHAARTRTRAAAVGSQRLTAELRHDQSEQNTIWVNRVLNNTVLWDITLCDQLKVNRRFGRTYRLNFQGRFSRVRLIGP
jgi:hypothetical protein